MEARASSDLRYIGMWNITFIIMWPLHNQSYCNISMKNGSNVIIWIIHNQWIGVLTLQWIFTPQKQLRSRGYRRTNMQNFMLNIYNNYIACLYTIFQLNLFWRCGIIVFKSFIDKSTCLLSGLNSTFQISTGITEYLKKNLNDNNWRILKIKLILISLETVINDTS